MNNSDVLKVIESGINLVANSSQQRELRQKCSNPHPTFR